MRTEYAVIALILIGAATFTPTANAQDAATELSDAFARVAEDALPAVVFIEVEREVKAGMPDGMGPFNDPFDLFGDDFFERFFRRRQPQGPPREGTRPRPRFKQRGQGSGFIVSGDGTVLTNHHVVGEAETIRVSLPDGRRFEAYLVGTDPHTDVAVVRLKGDLPDLPVLPLGSADDLRVGEWVLALGNPFGLTHTVTAGIVSAKGRSRVGIADYEDFIQTDAAINPGNSGGPLVDLHGKVVGINSAIFSRTGGYQGIGFAIPIDLARRVQDQILQKGSVHRGYLGVLIQDLTPDLRAGLSLEVEQGALVAQVTEDSPAHRAGMQVGDVIVEIDGEAVTNVADLRNRVALSDPGTTVRLSLMRGKERITTEVKLGELGPEGKELPPPSKEEPGGDPLGLTVAPQSGEGVVIESVRPDSPGAMAGIQAGNIILRVDSRSVSTPEEYHQAVEDARERDQVILLLKDDRGSRFVVVKPGSN